MAEKCSRPDSSTRSLHDVTTIAHLEEVLSPEAFEQLMRLQRIDIYHVDYSHQEEEYRDALWELERVESLTAILFKVMLQVKRTQNIYDQRMGLLEDEIQKVRTDIQDLLAPLKASYAQAEGALRKERRAMEVAAVQSAERVDALQTSLTKTEFNVGALQTQWAANRCTLDEIDRQLIPMQSLAQSVAVRISEMEEKEGSFWTMLKAMQEDLHELQENTVQTDDHSARYTRTLESELQTARQGSAPDSPRFGMPTRGHNGWWDVPDYLQESSRNVTDSNVLEYEESDSLGCSSDSGHAWGLDISTGDVLSSSGLSSQVPGHIVLDCNVSSHHAAISGPSLEHEEHLDMNHSESYHVALHQNGPTAAVSSVSDDGSPDDHLPAVVSVASDCAPPLHTPMHTESEIETGDDTFQTASATAEPSAPSHSSFQMEAVNPLANVRSLVSWALFIILLCTAWYLHHKTPSTLSSHHPVWEWASQRARVG